MRDISKNRLVFIVGAQRSGTTWLQLLLSASPKIATANETHLFSSYLESCFRVWHLLEKNSRQIGLGTLIRDTEYFALLKMVSDDILGRVADLKPGAEIILEKTPDHIYHWQSILSLYPDAFFLNLLRDPRSVVSSMLDAQKDWGANFVPKTIGDMCRNWSACIASGQEIKDATHNYYEVRYEALKNNSGRTLSDIFKRLGVPITDADCAEIIKKFSIENLTTQRSSAPWDLSKEPARFYRRGAADGWRDELSRSQIAFIEFLLSADMKALHYEQLGSSWRAAPLVISDKIRDGLRWLCRRI